MKYKIILGLLLASFSISAQVTSIDTLVNDTTKVIKKVILNKNSTAQSTMSLESENRKFLPNYSPLSPNAAAVQKFQDYQVNLVSGSPNVSFNLFTAKSGNITLPITLRYNAFNGHPLTDLASWVGWGWSLDLGINMSRDIRGAADDNISTTNYLNTVTDFNWDLCANVSDFSNAPFVSEGTYDLEPDIYSYSIGSAAGKFNLKKSTLDPFLIPYQPVKIAHDYVTGSRINQWKITGPDGNVYVFGKDKNNNLIQDWQYSDDVNQLYVNSGTTSWHATEILSPNTDDKIEIEYYPEEIPKKEINLNSYSWSAAAVTEGPGLSQFIDPVSSMQRRFNTQQYINKIKFDNGYLEFIISDNTEIRLDMQESKILKQINVYNYENGVAVLIKSFRFNHSYFTDRTGSNGRLKLDSYDEGNGTFTHKLTTAFEYFTNSYSWKYNSGGLGADIEDFKKQDYFGYFNGKLNNHTFDIENYTLNESFSNLPVLVNGGKANRDTDPQYLTEGVLKKIVLPTGGFSEFEFEPHQFKLGNTNRIGGGLRVKSIANKLDANTLATFKTYQYSCEDGLNLGKLTNTWSLPATKVVGYQTAINGLTKSIFFSPDGDLIPNAIDGTPIYYTTVKEFSTVGSVSNGHKESQFSFYRDTQFDGIEYAVHDLQPWKRGQVLVEKVYDASNNLISNINYEYTEFKNENLKNKGKVFNRSVNPAFVSCASGMPSAYAGGCGNCPQYTYYSNFSKTGVMKLTKSNSIINGINTETTNDYDGYLMPIVTTVLDSKNQENKTEIMYSTNAIYNSDPIIQSLKSRNVIVPIETVNSLVKVSGSVITAREKTFYSNFAGTNAANYTLNLLPSSVWVAKTGGVLEKRVEFNSYYPNGNPKEYTVDGQPTTLIWGYNDALLIGEIKNANFTTVSNLITSTEINLPEFSVTNLSPTNLVKLRNFQNGLQGALSSWYTHRPLIGISEKYEPNSIKTSFEYDGLLRLSYIRDTNGKLIKSNTYNYKGQ